jgi:hypothetical protein
MDRNKRGNIMSNYKKKVTLVRLDSALQTERHRRTMKSIKEANASRKTKKPLQNKAKIEKEWRDSWFTTKD